MALAAEAPAVAGFDRQRDHEVVVGMHDPLRRVELAGDEAHRVYRGGRYKGTVVLFLTEFFLASGLDRGWSRIADVEIEPVSGNHVTLALEPHVRVLAERLNARAEAAEVRHRMRETSNA